MANQVTLVGIIKSGFNYSHTVYGEAFYTSIIEVIRDSGKPDLIPLLISEKLITKDDIINRKIYVSGEYRSYNEYSEDKSRLKLFVFVNIIEPVITEDNINDVFLEGYICKQPIYRLTPLGRQITDVLLAVNRSYNKSDYIPCVIWGRNALYTKDLTVGQRVRVAGRIQSREYTKNNEVKTAYELSVNLVELS